MSLELRSKEPAARKNTQLTVSCEHLVHNCLAKANIGTISFTRANYSYFDTSLDSDMD